MVEVHPFANEIKEWKPSASQLFKLPAPMNLMYTWVDTEVVMKDVARQLTKEIVISFDTEGHNEYSYLGMICLIQISTYEWTYIFDCIALYSLIQKYLGPIFESPDILKVVCDSGDVTELQRDFHIFCQAVVDIQEVYYFLNPSKFQISLRDLVFTVYEKNIDKVPQLADWRMRPLHDDLIQYAANDSMYVLKLWYELLPKVDWSRCKLDRSKGNMLKLYRCPVHASNSFVFKDVLKLIPRGVNFEKQKSLFDKLYLWRIDICKQIDNSVHYFLPQKKLAVIIQNQPNSNSFLHRLVPSSKYWPLFVQETLLKQLRNDQDELETDGNELENEWCNFDVRPDPGVCPPKADNAPDTNDSSKLVVSNYIINDEVMTSEDESEDMLVSNANDNCDNCVNSVKPQEVNFANLISIRTGKTRRNHMYRVKRKAARARINEERKAQGLQVIKFKRSRGIKRDYGAQAKRLADLKRQGHQP
jgi:ribonuclease D